MDDEIPLLVSMNASSVTDDMRDFFINHLIIIHTCYQLINLLHTLIKLINATRR